MSKQLSGKAGYYEVSPNQAPSKNTPVPDSVLPTERFHYLDSIRGYAMMLGVFLHAGMAYGSEIQHFWFWQDPGESLLIEVLFQFVHMFRMEVFFLVAGFFACYLMIKRGTKGFVKNRALRIAVPFMMFWPLLTAAIVSLLLYSIASLEFRGEIMLLIDEAMKNPTGERLPPEMGALWFLYYLFQFCLIAAVVQYVRPSWLRAVVQNTFSSTLSLLWLPALLIPGLVISSDRPPLEFYLHLWPFLYYGIYFLFGWHIFRNRGFFDLLEARKYPLLAVGSALFVAYFMVREPMAMEQMIATNGYRDYSHAKLLEMALKAYSSFYLAAAFIGFGKSLFSHESTRSRYISDASYWVYLIHTPIVIALQMLLIDVDLNVFLKFGIVVVTTFAIAFIAYEYLVRYTWLGAILNGRKVRHKIQTAEGIAPGV